jgi:hypothetical protein
MILCIVISLMRTYGCTNSPNHGYMFEKTVFL